MILINQIRSVVQNNGNPIGAENSWNTRSTTQIRAPLTINPKSPKVIIRKGIATIFSIGLAKKLSKPRIIPNNKKICH